MGGNHMPQHHHRGRVSPGNYADYPDLTHSESKRLRTTETRAMCTDKHMANSLDEEDIASVSNWRRKNVDYIDRRQQYEGDGHQRMQAAGVSFAESQDHDEPKTETSRRQTNEGETYELHRSYSPSPRIENVTSSAFRRPHRHAHEHTDQYQVLSSHEEMFGHEAMYDGHTADTMERDRARAESPTHFLEASFSNSLSPLAYHMDPERQQYLTNITPSTGVPSFDSAHSPSKMPPPPASLLPPALPTTGFSTPTRSNLRHVRNDSNESEYFLRYQQSEGYDPQYLSLDAPSFVTEVTIDDHPPPAKKKQKKAEIPSEITANDVLCGRGGIANSHSGNKYFREVVKKHQDAYLSAKKREKPEIAGNIVHLIRQRGGRFLGKDKDSGKWVDSGFEKARDKASQALREGAPEIRIRKWEEARATAAALQNSAEKKKDKAITKHNSTVETRNDQEKVKVSIKEEPDAKTHPPKKLSAERPDASANSVTPSSTERRPQTTSIIKTQLRYPPTTSPSLLNQRESGTPPTTVWFNSPEDKDLYDSAFSPPPSKIPKRKSPDN
eukprot:scaffold62739_cov50-Attheya_sp.AAC.1